MSEELKNRSQVPADPTWTPASPVKRTWAWVGVIYVVLSLLLVVWFLATASFLRGVGGVMLSPALVGLGLTGLFWSKEQKNSTRRKLYLALAAVCAVGLAAGLVTGIPALLAQL